MPSVVRVRRRFCQSVGWIATKSQIASPVTSTLVMPLWIASKTGSAPLAWVWKPVRMKTPVGFGVLPSPARIRPFDFFWSRLASIPVTVDWRPTLSAIDSCVIGIHVWTVSIGSVVRVQANAESVAALVWATAAALSVSVVWMK